MATGITTTVLVKLYPIYPILYPLLSSVFPNCLWSGNTQEKIAALTFDDGPHPRYTPDLLNVLDRHQVTASFFWLGQCVRRSPEVAKQVRDRGHYIGLHGDDHRNFTHLNRDELRRSLERTQAAISDACGIDGGKIRDVRPPNGLFAPRTLQLLRQWNYRPVMWSVVPEDWTRPGVKIVVDRVLREVRSGSLIVLHDGNFGGPDVAETVDRLVPRLRDRGYRLVTIEQL